MKPEFITAMEAEKIWDKHEPLGLFYLIDTSYDVVTRTSERYVAIDNSDGEARTSTFTNREHCLAWLEDHMDDVQVYCSYMDTEVAELDVFVTCPYCGETNKERDKTDPGSTYDLECGACEREYTMYFDAD